MGMARRRLPEGIFALPLQVRSYEVGSEGRVRPANILRYFEYLATEASTGRGFDHTWYEQHGTAWVVREMRLVAGSLPQIGEQLGMATWLSSYGRVQAYREYALWREGDSRLVARAQGRWAYVDRVTGQLRRLPEDLISRFGALGHAMPLVQLRDVVATDERGAFSLSARTYEADSNCHINNAVYMDWVEEAVALALEAAPADAAQVAQLRRLHVEYLRPAMPGDRIAAEVALAHLGRGVAVHGELHDERLGQPVARAQALYLLESLSAPPAQ
jgi:acyl-CoA thioesterase FadM